MDGRLLEVGNSQPFRHFVVKKSAPGPIRLHPLAVDHKLGYGPFSCLFDDFVSCTRGSFDVDFGERKAMRLEESLGFAAIWAPLGGIDGDLHAYPILPNRTGR